MLRAIYNPLRSGPRRIAGVHRLRNTYPQRGGFVDRSMGFLLSVSCRTRVSRRTALCSSLSLSRARARALGIRKSRRRAEDQLRAASERRKAALHRFNRADAASRRAAIGDSDKVVGLIIQRRFRRIAKCRYMHLACMFLPRVLLPCAATKITRHAVLKVEDISSVLAVSSIRYLIS